MNESFLIFKNKDKKEGSNQPDYRVVMRDGDNFVTWGAGWIKDGKSGKFISCQKNKPFDKTKAPKTREDDFNEF